MYQRLRTYLVSKKVIIFSILSFLIPFIIYLLTLERKLIGGDTTWYAIEIPEMLVFVPTGYPTFSLLGKLFTFLPIADMAYRLNLFSAVFGALTILFLFLSINKLVKNEIISISGSMILAFLYPYWHVANRLEFDTLNSFFIILVIYSAIIYNEKKNSKLLYFFFFSLGLSLTNHPIAFFVVPAILLYVIIVNPRIFKSIKVIFASILWFIVPLLSYFYIYIRSLQGYGEVTSFRRFFYYITGRVVSGEMHGGGFGGVTTSSYFRVLRDYLNIIYDNFGVVLIIIAIIGFVYLIKKNLKFGICSFLLIILNLSVPPTYLTYANPNYIIDSMLVVTIYIAFGFLLILEASIYLFNKSLKNKKMLKVDKILKYFLLVIIFITFALQPVLLVYANYRSLDYSEPKDAYKFWDEAFTNINEGSIVYTYAFANNVGRFVNMYEYGDKNIILITHKDTDYSNEKILQNFEDGETIYFVGNEAFFKFHFISEIIGKHYYIPRYTERLRLNKVVSMFKSLLIDYRIESHKKKFGEKFTIEYTIENKNLEAVKITSLELELPDNIEFVGVEPEGYINQGPGMSRGIYMWVSDEYFVGANSKINLIVDLQGTAPGKGVIDFRITANDAYIEADGIDISIE